MSTELILGKLDDLSTRLSDIEKVVTTLAVQDEKIINIQSQVANLCDKYDEAFGSSGVITETVKFQSSCPRDTLKDTIDNQQLMIRAQWVVILLFSGITTGTLFKALGMF